MKSEQIKRYVEIKMQIANLEAEVNILKPVILEEMTERNIDKLTTEEGDINIQKRKTWKYSGNVTSLKDALDKEKEKEESDGTASFTEVAILEFRKKKEK